MRFFALAVTFTLTGVLATSAIEPSPEPDGGNDAKTLLGTWDVVKAAKEGKPAPPAEVNGMKMKIDKDTLTIIEPNRKGRGEVVKYKLDMKAKPRAMDLSINQLGGVTILAIYKIEKGQLTLCFSKQGKARPKTFDEKTYTVLVMRKEKANK